MSTRQRQLVFLCKRAFACGILHPRLLQQLEECRPNLSSFNQIHAQMLVSGLFFDSFAASRLLKFLTQKLDPPDVHRAELLFSQIRYPDLVTFNLLLQAVSQSSNPLRSFVFYRDLLRRDLRPNGYTLCFLFGCCPGAQALQLHGHLTKMGLRNCPYAATSLVQFYGDSGDPDLAQKLFDEMPERTEVSWAVLTRSYAENGRLSDALEMISSTRKLGFELCNSALVCVLCKCADLGEFFAGKMLHGLITITGMELNVTLGTSLIRMYAKSGCSSGSAAAAAVFSSMSKKTVGSWNCMIHGLALNGGASASILLFEQMSKLKIRPDGGTFIGVLTACRHSGSIPAGAEFFTQMIRNHGISPNLKHYGCLVDLYSRSGYLREALEIARRMPMEPDAAIWGAILSSCRERGDLLIGEMVAAKMVKLFPGECAGYLFLSELHATSMRWGGVVSARKMMAEMEAWKTAPGCSLLVQ